MPISKSAIKRMRSDKKKEERNVESRSKLKTLFKKHSKNVEAKDVEATKQSAKIADREFDKAASKGIIPKKRAARKKSRIQKRLNKLSATDSK